MTKILVAEDERDIRDLIGFTLRFAGFEVVTYPDGAEALQAAPQEMPHSMPSSRASLRAKAIASALSIVSTRSTMERSRVSGTGCHWEM